MFLKGIHKHILIWVNKYSDRFLNPHFHLTAQGPRCCHIPIFPLRDVHSGPPHGRDTSAWTLPRPRAISRRHDGPKPRSFTWLSPQHDGAQPRASWLWTPPPPTGTLRISSGQHAPDAQSTTYIFISLFTLPPLIHFPLRFTQTKLWYWRNRNLSAVC